MIQKPNIVFHSGKYTLEFIDSKEEIREIQALRYKIFNEELDVGNTKNDSNLDADKFDDVCHHMVIRFENTIRITLPRAS